MPRSVDKVALWCGWAHWLQAVVLRERQFVCINLDETMVRHEYLSPSGNVIKAPGRSLRAANLFFQHTKGSQEKAGTTLMAMLCNNETLQPHLPQIWLPKDTARKPMLNRTRHEFELRLADKYPQQVWGGTTGWMTAPLFSVVLRMVRQRVREVLGPHWLIVMIFDAAGAHSSESVLKLANELGMVLLLIPGQLTWLLQMLDVKVFWHFKQRLRKDCMQARLNSNDGRLPPHGWVPFAVDATQDLLVHRMWSRAFDVMRIPSADVPLNSYRRVQAIAPTTAADLPAMPLTPAQVDQIFGRHRRSLAPVLFESAVRIMPSLERAALEDRLVVEETLEIADAPAAFHPVVESLAAAMHPPPDASESIGGRVALRRRTKDA